MKDIARRLNAYIESHPLDLVTVIAKPSWSSFIKPMLKPKRVILRRSVMDLRNWRNFCTPCRWRTTTQCSTSAAACAVPTNAKHSAMASSMARI